jgi:beta-N-acetylhexosaminidase
VGCAGTELSDQERTLFRDADPLGFILFSRNCGTPAQVRALVAELRACVGRDDAPVLIDQEGGRVARLGPPHWRPSPAAGRFATLARRDRAAATEAARLNARMMAAELRDLGITVDCAPVLDMPQPNADPVIGDRAYGDAPEQIAALGAAVCEGLLAGGVTPTIKHLPGHGRAAVDSHKALPIVEAALDALDLTDFAPFRAVAGMPFGDALWGMTAHVVYSAVDPEAPATTSAPVIEEVIRGTIGFAGFLISDDVEMNALSGRPGERAAAALAAGCDAVLHCSGDLESMSEVLAAAAPLGDIAAERLARAAAARPQPQVLNIDEAEKRLVDIMAEARM